MGLKAGGFQPSAASIRAISLFTSASGVAKDITNRPTTCGLCQSLLRWQGARRPVEITDAGCLQPCLRGGRQDRKHFIRLAGPGEARLRAARDGLRQMLRHRVGVAGEVEPVAVGQQSFELGADEPALGERLAGALAAPFHLGGAGGVEEDDRLGRPGAVLGAAEGEHVDTGFPGDVGRAAAQRHQRIGEAGAIHVQGQTARRSGGLQCADLVGGVDGAAFGRLGDRERPAAGPDAARLRGKRASVCVMSSGASLLPAPGRPISLAPSLKNSGAPHSSSATWLSSWVMTAPQGRVRLASASCAFAEVLN